MELMSKGHFMTLVAKNAVTNTHGPATATWPDDNFWALVSTVKFKITEDQLPQLMKSYKITELSDYKLPPEETIQ